MRPDHHGHHAGAEDRSADRLDAGEVAVGVDDDADHPPVGRPRLTHLRQRGGRLEVDQRDRRLGHRQTESGRDLGAQSRFDVREALELPLLDRLLVALAELERVRPDDVFLLDRRHAQPELPHLAVVVVVRRRLRAHLGGFGDPGREVLEDVPDIGTGVERAAAVERVRLVRRDSGMNMQSAILAVARASAGKNKRRDDLRQPQKPERAARR